MKRCSAVMVCARRLVAFFHRRQQSLFAFARLILDRFGIEPEETVELDHFAGSHELFRRAADSDIHHRALGLRAGICEATVRFQISS